MQPHLPHLMLDIETLGTGPDACIIQVGAVAFCPEQNLISPPHAVFELNVRHDSDPMSRGGMETVAWWIRQAIENRSLADRVFSQRGAQDMSVVCRALREYLCVHETQYLWSCGPTFDSALMQAAFRRHEVSWPLPYNADRDFRTLHMFAELLGVEKPPFLGMKHTGGDDALHQAGFAILIMQRMKELVGREDCAITALEQAVASDAMVQSLPASVYEAYNFLTTPVPEPEDFPALAPEVE